MSDQPRDSARVCLGVMEEEEARMAQVGEAGSAALPAWCLELIAAGHLLRGGTVRLALPPSGQPPGPLLKASSRLASLRVVVLSQESRAALTSAMTWAVVSGKATPLPPHAFSSADTPI